MDPLFDNIKELPEFKFELGNIKTSFRKFDIRLRNSLEEEGLI